MVTIGRHLLEFYKHFLHTVFFRSLANSKIKHVIHVIIRVIMNSTLESVLKSIPGGSAVIDQFTLFCQGQASNLSFKVGSVTNGSVQVNASGRF